MQNFTKQTIKLEKKQQKRPKTNGEIPRKKEDKMIGRQSVGLHDEINWIIAIVGLCSLSEGNYPWIYGGE